MFTFLVMKNFSIKLIIWKLGNSKLTCLKPVFDHKKGTYACYCIQRKKSVRFCSHNVTWNSLLRTPSNKHRSFSLNPTYTFCYIFYCDIKNNDLLCRKYFGYYVKLLITLFKLLNLSIFALNFHIFLKIFMNINQFILIKLFRSQP